MADNASSNKINPAAPTLFVKRQKKYGSKNSHGHEMQLKLKSIQE